MVRRSKKGRQGGKKISNTETLPEISNKETLPEISSKATPPELPDVYDDLNCPLHLYLKCVVAAPMPGRLVKVLVDCGTIVKKGQPMFVMVPSFSNNSSIDLLTHVRFNNPTSSDISGDRQLEVLARMDGEALYLSVKEGTPLSEGQPLFFLPSPTNDWAENIKKEWISLQERLPDTIYVSAYESRMDLLRAVIIGLEGTPYHNGLFFFDVCLPEGYPHQPPLVRYHSAGLDINPNLKKTGVYLKLPSTTDSKEEKEEDMWVPGTSTMLHLLVSIQNQILCANPLLCDPAATKRTNLYAQQSALLYVENTFIKSLKTMEYIINNPPKNFEDFVVGHFRNHATDILIACKEEASKESCTTNLKRYLDLCFNSLVIAFSKIGAKLPQDFLPLVEKKSLFA